jgi:ABC-type ATPase involved in cell division
VTVVIATHDRSFAEQLPARIINLEQGRVCA